MCDLVLLVSSFGPITSSLVCGHHFFKNKTIQQVFSGQVNGQKAFKLPVPKWLLVLRNPNSLTIQFQLSVSQIKDTVN